MGEGRERFRIVRPEGDEPDGDQDASQGEQENSAPQVDGGDRTPSGSGGVSADHLAIFERMMRSGAAPFVPRSKRRYDRPGSPPEAAGQAEPGDASTTEDDGILRPDFSRGRTSAPTPDSQPPEPEE